MANNNNDGLRENFGHVSGDLFKWIVSAILTLVTTLGGTWLNKVQDQQKEITHLANTNAQKIAALETRVDITKEVSNQRLDRIEAKLDVLISSDRRTEGGGK